MVFGEIDDHNDNTTATIRGMVQEIRRAWEEKAKPEMRDRHVSMVGWKYPPDEWAKLNVDGCVTVSNVHELHTLAGYPKQCLKVLAAMPIME